MAKQLVRQKSRKEVRATTAQMYKNEEASELANFERAQSAASAFYAGIDPRRRIEVADAGMVQEDYRAIANLPTRFIHSEYPRTGFKVRPYIDDSELE